jgi:glycosyltransferase involved in cell wall biosynthesis|tara:strand:+ start:156 stop:1478 length:1323 start_codon:yes stop_codon:yes gene_type:complete
MKPMILVTAPVQTRSGYGNHSRDICRALIESDKYDVRIQAVRWGTTPPTALEKDNPIHKEIEKRIMTEANLERQPDLHIHIVIPNEFQPIGKKNIGVTAGIETTIPPAKWLEGVNRMDLTICTSEFAKSGLKDTTYDKQDVNTGQAIGELKVVKPLDVLFEGADPEIYKEVKDFSEGISTEFTKINDEFCFLFVGHWLNGNLGEDRKDVGMMLKVFFESFKNQKNPPALILKTSSAGFSVVDKKKLFEKINMIKSDVTHDTLPNVYLLHGDLTDSEMNEMYNHPKVKAHLTFTHGEGFGRPLLEASFSGKPVIAPISTGQADFLDKSYTVELPHTMTKIPKAAFPKEFQNSEAKWSTVNYNSASKIMKDVFNKYENYRLKGKKQMIVNRELFTQEKMQNKLESIVDKMLDSMAQKVELKLPKLQERADSVKLKLPTLKKG